MNATRSALIFVAVALLLACSLGAPAIPFVSADPADLARQAFEDWVKGQTIAYRNASFETLSSTEAIATVKITAEFQSDENAPWLEQEATVKVVKQGNQWQRPTSFSFALSSGAVQTLQANRNATATAQTSSMQATAAARSASDSATRQAATATQQAVQATAAAEGTKQAVARATDLALRTVAVNRPMVVQSVQDDQSQLREYFKNLEFVLADVVRASETSVLWHFYVWNHNSSDYVELSSTGQPYTVASNGTKFNALPWNAVSVVAGERKDFVIGFAAPSAPGSTFRLYLSTWIRTGPSFHDTAITWRPVDITLR